MILRRNSVVSRAFCLKFYRKSHLCSVSFAVVRCYRKKKLVKYRLRLLLTPSSGCL